MPKITNTGANSKAAIVEQQTPTDSANKLPTIICTFKVIIPLMILKIIKAKTSCIWLFSFSMRQR